ncbi:MAG: CHAT domain-containing protein [Sulfuriflexus sp.]|nr:CHAT domain-containing protein [Sulfuriflexus sp.]
MNKCRIITPVLLLALTLTGCSTTISNKAVQGEHKQVVAIAESSGNFQKLTMDDHHKVCKSLVKLREFKVFFTCHKSLSQRVAANNGYLEFSSPNIISFSAPRYNQPWSTYFLETMLSEAYLALGQYDDVIEHAGKALKVADTQVFLFGAEQDVESNIFRKAVLDVVTLGQDKDVKKNRNDAISILSMGHLGLAHIGLKQSDLAVQYAKRITAVDTGTLTARGYDVERRASAARIYFANKEYTEALKAMQSESQLGLGGLFIDGLTVANYANPANYILSPFYFGTTNMQDLQYIYKFESQFMLYRCQLETGDLVNAKKGYNEALAEPRLSNFGRMYYLVLYDRGRIALQEGDTEVAVRLFKKAISVIESQRSSITLERFKIGFAGDKQAVYSSMVETLVKLGRAGEALEYAERGKARALVDLLAYRKDFSTSTQPARTRELLRELDELERVSLATTSKAKGASTRTVSGTRDAIKAANPELASLVTVSALSFKKIQSNLRKDEALLEYFYQGEGDLFAFVVTTKKIDVFTLSGKDLKESVRQFRAAINTYPGNSWAKGSQALYERLISPLYPAIKNKKHLTIVPHGVLHYLPFNALRKGRFLIETHTIRLLPSASILQFLKKKNNPTSSLLVLGNPDLNNPDMDLPGAESEARAIAGSWKDSKVILRKQASETLFKKVSGQFRYIHLASHGEFNPDTPQNSRMLLSADASNDGNLTISEIYDLRLNADMVTLSACQTGLGDVKNGDDVVGLNRGFLYAGAKSIVASLWSVPDESTRVLMTAFYKNLRKMDKRSSMQQAQIKGIKKYKHPIAWAAFQMTGGI